MLQIQYSCTYSVSCELQMWMNVLETLTCAISMQIATILKEVTPALATVGMQAMGYFAQVSASIF